MSISRAKGLTECDVFKADDSLTYLESTVYNENKVKTDIHIPKL